MSTSKIKNELDISYEGPFNMRIISAIGKYLSEFLDTSYEVRMCLYRVFIEICQNVALYSIERAIQEKDCTIGLGKLSIIENDSSFICTTVNRVKPGHNEILKTNCNSINDASINELIKLKEKLRRESSIDDYGAHIGLISIRLFSKNSLKFDIIEMPEDDSKLFSISAIINKN